MDDPQEFVEQIAQVCALYQQAPTLAQQGGPVVSTDEMTGIQALERAAPTLPMQSGQGERREFEYVRHGTLSLIANFAGATGQIVAPALGPTRTEADFAAQVRQTVAGDPQAGWIFILDHLNTPQSATLVRWVAAVCGLTTVWGTKGQDGILASMPSRAAFLSDPRQLFVAQSN